MGIFLGKSRLSWLVLLFVLVYGPLVFSRQPNVVLIIADDLGYGELGCYGGSEIPTPALDALAQRGVRFTDGYVTAPFCAASRAGLLTGRYQTSFGFEFNPIGAKNAEPGVGLPASVTTIADRLRAVGYATGLVGKWHLGGTAPFHPQRRGFDHFYGFLHEGHFYSDQSWDGMTTWLRRKSLPSGTQGVWTRPDGQLMWSSHMGHDEPPYDADNPVMRGSQPVPRVSDLSTQLTDEAVAFVKQHRHQPFFLTLAYNAVHSPMQARNDYVRRHQAIENVHRRIFAGMLSQLDDSIERLMVTLGELALDDETLVVFLSDNGGPTKELTSRNDPLRGGKGQLLEGGIRVPILMVWPGVTSSRVVIREPINALDIAVSLVEAGGADTSKMEGTSLKTLISGSALQSPRPPLFWRVGQQRAVRSGKWKLLRTAESDWRLYDLELDIGETVDLSAQQREIVEAMSAAWDDWNSKQKQPLW